jgi:hypothetical protein
MQNKKNARETYQDKHHKVAIAATAMDKINQVLRFKGLVN